MTSVCGVFFYSPWVGVDTVVSDSSLESETGSSPTLFRCVEDPTTVPSGSSFDSENKDSQPLFTWGRWGWHHSRFLCTSRDWRWTWTLITRGRGRGGPVTVSSRSPLSPDNRSGSSLFLWGLLQLPPAHPGDLTRRRTVILRRQGIGEGDNLSTVSFGLFSLPNLICTWCRRVILSQIQR